MKTFAKWSSAFLSVSAVAFAFIAKGFIGSPELPAELKK